MLQSTRAHGDILVNEQREYLNALDEAKVRLAKDLRRVSLQHNFRHLLSKVTPFSFKDAPLVQSG